MRQLRSHEGYTLVEITVAVFILGLLVTLVAPRIMGQMVKDKRAKAGADVAQISQALQIFKSDNGFYPATPDGLQALTLPGKPPRGRPDGYLSSVPVDPWGNAYAYFTDGGRFLVKSYGADGREGGTGDDADVDSAES
jgi:general secretion pathway protein G